MAAKKALINGDDKEINARVRKNAVKVDKVLRGAVPAHVLATLQKAADEVAAELIWGELGIEVPRTLVALEKLNKKMLGQYHPGRDGLGLRWRIDMNVAHLNRPMAAVLRTLLHEVLHAVQDDYGFPGKSNFHNSEFQSWAWYLGIETNEFGHDLGTIPGSLFDEYCKRNKLDGAEKLIATTATPKAGGSKLKKWTCSCGVNVRVSIPFFDATCDQCGTKFKLQEKAGADSSEG